MKKTVSALLAVATIAGSLVTAVPSAQAQRGRDAAAIGLGLLGAAVVGSAIVNSNRPAYGYDGGPVYYRQAPRCYWEQRPVWDPYLNQNVYRRVKICPGY